MEFENLLTLIKTVSDSELTDFDYEENGTRIRLKKKKETVVVAGASADVPTAPLAAAQAAIQNSETVADADITGQKLLSSFRARSKSKEDKNFAPKQNERDCPMTADSEPEGMIVKSPLVGTFYAAPAEDAAPFVSVGDLVKKGQTLAIVEAMKLMNEIESDFDGKVAEVYVENGQAVEYGQPLFRIV